MILLNYGYWVNRAVVKKCSLDCFNASTLNYSANYKQSLQKKNLFNKSLKAI